MHSQDSLQFTLGEFREREKVGSTVRIGMCSWDFG